MSLGEPFCGQCLRVVDEEGLIREREPHGEVMTRCGCGNWDLVEAFRCDSCGDWTPGDELVDGTDYCGSCYEELEAAGEFA